MFFKVASEGQGVEVLVKLQMAYNEWGIIT
jgi:hypothetical protein